MNILDADIKSAPSDQNILELFRLERPRFLLGEFVKYLERSTERFGLVLGLKWAGFCRESSIGNVWLSRSSVLVGFTKIDIVFETPGHLSGATFAICASRT